MNLLDRYNERVCIVRRESKGDINLPILLDIVLMYLEKEDLNLSELDMKVRESIDAITGFKAERGDNSVENGISNVLNKLERVDKVEYKDGRWRLK